MRFKWWYLVIIVAAVLFIASTKTTLTSKKNMNPSWWDAPGTTPLDRLNYLSPLPVHK